MASSISAPVRSGSAVGTARWQKRGAFACGRTPAAPGEPPCVPQAAGHSQPGTASRPPPGARTSRARGKGCGARRRPPPHTMGTGATHRTGRPVAAPRQPRCSPRAGEGRPERLPVLCSLVSTFCLRPAGGARREDGGGSSKWEAAKKRQLPPSPPSGHPALIAVVAAESGSAAFVTPPLAGARCWGAWAAAASPFFCCCRLQWFALARPSLRCGSSHQPLPGALSRGRRRRRRLALSFLPLRAHSSLSAAGQAPQPPRRVGGEPAARLRLPAVPGRGGSMEEDAPGQLVTVPVCSPRGNF